ncbi:hypothetical protein [Celerinatantimonas yamalensis]|uniref:Uncharacterized protein n=1 Tax=Celerinatantimonas yamalensis TaxID=559956 RepID=A0ABW9G724_9GAMM
MSASLLPLKLIMRIEPGCLGPEGALHVERFCEFASEPFNRLGGQAMDWQLIPRFDKQLPEIEYWLNEHKLTATQAQRYLKLWSIDLEQQEEHTSELLSELIDLFWQRR